MRNLIFYLLILQLISFFLGIRIGWTLFQYDELRIIQVLLGAISFIYIIVYSKIKFSKQAIFTCIFIIFFIIYFFKTFSIFQFQDLMIFLSLLSIFIALLQSDYKVNLIFLILIFSCIIPCFFIFLSVFNLFYNVQWFDWQLNGGSIRIYDSTIIPIFYFSVYLRSINYNHIEKIYPLIIFMIGLALFFDGARSGIISCILPIMIMLVMSEKYRDILIKTILYFFASFSFYFVTFKLFHYLNELDRNLSVSRLTTSSRLEIWSYVYYQWLNNPLRGLGGGFLAQTKQLSVLHMHNLYLRLIFEWGIMGVTLLVFLFYNFIKLMGSNKVSLILKLGVLGIAIDSLFSGNWIYPSSQLISILYFSFVYSFYYDEFNIASIQLKISKIIIIVFGTLFFYILYFYFFDDLSCYKCGSYGGLEAPNFWHYGGAERLIDGSEIP